MIRNQFRIRPVQRPDEMTFKQLLEHATRSMYWDQANELWTCVTIVDREFWDVLANQLEEAHDRETGAAMSENTKLREQGARLFDKTLELGTENAKLRELMRDTYDCICEMYRYMDGRYACEDAEDDDEYGPILRRMRELGIEVKDES